MKKLLVLAIASLFTTAAVAGDMKWSGSAAVRYNNTVLNDGLQATTAVGTGVKDISKTTTKAHAIRANIGAAGGWDKMEWGVGFRTGGAATTTSDWVNYAAMGDQAVGIEQAWFKYNNDWGFGDISAIVGRQKNVFAHDMMTEQLFDKDLRFDGFGWTWKWGSFGLNASQYVIGASNNLAATGASTYTTTAATEAGANTQRRFGVLYGFQPHMHWRFTDSIDAMFAVGFYKWSNVVTAGNAVHGFTTPSATGDNGTLVMDNMKQWQVLAMINLPYNLMFSGEYVMNKEQKYGSAATIFSNNNADKSALALGLSYGKLKRAHDFTIGYAYNMKGLGAVANAQTNNLLPADANAHFVKAAYNLAENFSLGWQGIFADEKSKKQAANGNAITGPQKNTRSYWELVAGVSF